MKKAIILAAILLLAPAILSAACIKNGDPAIWYGWGQLDPTWTGYTPPPGVYVPTALGNHGPDTTSGLPCQKLTFLLAPYNATAWNPLLCTAADTFCFVVSTTNGWTLGCTPAQATPTIVATSTRFKQQVDITIPATATLGTYERVIARFEYTNTAIACDPSCTDCGDPNQRPSTGHYYYSSDTLYVHVLTPPPAPPSILQDTLTLIEQGLAQAYVPFSFCNSDQCFAHDIAYHITSKGHIGSAQNINNSINVGPGKCGDVFVIINAGSANVCVYDTLTAICWTVVATPLYDTCVMVLHVVEPSSVPLFTVPVVTILVLALILAAAVFMRRRAVSRA